MRSLREGVEGILIRLEKPPLAGDKGEKEMQRVMGRGHGIKEWRRAGH